VPGCQKLQTTAKPGLAQDALQLQPYGNSGRQRVKNAPSWAGKTTALSALVTTSGTRASSTDDFNNGPV